MTTAAGIITSIDEFDRLEGDWNELACRFRTPLLRFEWFRAAADAFCPPGKLAVLVERSDGELVAAAPLVERSKYGVARMELLGTSILGEPSGLLYKNHESLAAIVRRVLGLRKPLLMGGLAASSPEIAYLNGARGCTHPFVNVTGFSSPWIPITTTWDKFFATVSGRWRSTLRRAERRAKEFGPVTYEIISPGEEEVGGCLSELYAVEMAGWKSRVGTAMQAFKELGDFFNGYARAAARKGMLRIAFLRIGGEPAAAQLLVEYAGRHWVLKVGYDEKFARCSPGILLMNEVIRRSFEAKHEAFELLGTNQPWLGVWPHELHDYQTYGMFPSAPFAMAARGIEVSTRAVHKLRSLMAKKRKAAASAPAESEA